MADADFLTVTNAKQVWRPTVIAVAILAVVVIVGAFAVTLGLDLAQWSLAGSAGAHGGLVFAGYLGVALAALALVGVLVVIAAERMRRAILFGALLLALANALFLAVVALASDVPLSPWERSAAKAGTGILAPAIAPR
jgi:hypothetical protein